MFKALSKVFRHPNGSGGGRRLSPDDTPHNNNNSNGGGGGNGHHDPSSLSHQVYSFDDARGTQLPANSSARRQSEAASHSGRLWGRWRDTYRGFSNSHLADGQPSTAKYSSVAETRGAAGNSSGRITTPMFTGPRNSDLADGPPVDYRFSANFWHKNISESGSPVIVNGRLSKGPVVDSDGSYPLIQENIEWHMRLVPPMNESKHTRVMRYVRIQRKHVPPPSPDLADGAAPYTDDCIVPPLRPEDSMLLTGKFPADQEAAMELANTRREIRYIRDRLSAAASGSLYERPGLPVYTSAGPAVPRDLRPVSHPLSPPPQSMQPMSAQETGTLVPAAVATANRNARANNDPSKPAAIQLEDSPLFDAHDIANSSRLLRNSAKLPPSLTVQVDLARGPFRQDNTPVAGHLSPHSPSPQPPEPSKDSFRVSSESPAHQSNNHNNHNSIILNTGNGSHLAALRHPSPPPGIPNSVASPGQFTRASLDVHGSPPTHTTLRAVLEDQAVSDDDKPLLLLKSNSTLRGRRGTSLDRDLLNPAFDADDDENDDDDRPLGVLAKRPPTMEGVASIPTPRESREGSGSIGRPKTPVDDHHIDTNSGSPNLQSIVGTHHQDAMLDPPRSAMATFEPQQSLSSSGHKSPTTLPKQPSTPRSFSIGSGKASGLPAAPTQRLSSGAAGALIDGTGSETSSDDRPLLPQPKKPWLANEAIPKHLPDRRLSSEQAQNGLGMASLRSSPLSQGQQYMTHSPQSIPRLSEGSLIGAATLPSRADIGSQVKPEGNLDARSCSQNLSNGDLTTVSKLSRLGARWSFLPSRRNTTPSMASKDAIKSTQTLPSLSSRNKQNDEHNGNTRRNNGTSTLSRKMNTISTLLSVRSYSHLRRPNQQQGIYGKKGGPNRNTVAYVEKLDSIIIPTPNSHNTSSDLRSKCAEDGTGASPDLSHCQQEKTEAAAVSRFGGKRESKWHRFGRSLVHGIVKPSPMQSGLAATATPIDSGNGSTSLQQSC